MDAASIPHRSCLGTVNIPRHPPRPPGLLERTRLNRVEALGRDATPDESYARVGVIEEFDDALPLDPRLVPGRNVGAELLHLLVA